MCNNLFKHSYLSNLQLFVSVCASEVPRRAGRAVAATESTGLGHSRPPAFLLQGVSSIQTCSRENDADSN